MRPAILGAIIAWPPVRFRPLGDAAPLATHAVRNRRQKSSSAAGDFCSAEYRYVVANNRVLLAGTSRIVVGIFADANAR
jgi:hypothetical protein